MNPQEVEEYVEIVLSIERAKRDRQKLDSTIRRYAFDDRFCRACGIETPSDILLDLPELKEEQTL